jgi:hypothetical protein
MKKDIRLLTVFHDFSAGIFPYAARSMTLIAGKHPWVANCAG